ncbi:MAG: hypothetical protein NW223_18105 [Hyphomicrobiaceae bacterium]|nr:hypothetical protein [Hyphomicrobiaceae bacterium]
MMISKSTGIVFNFAGALIGIAALAGAVRYTLFKPQIAPCETRYKQTMRFALEQNGKLLSTDELQARVGGRDKGLHNVAIAREPGAPKPATFKVSLPSGSHGPDAAANAGGARFPWEPRVLASRTAACLAYDMMLSKDFDFSENGLLPGFVGADAQDDERFEVHLSWDRSGEGTVRHRITSKAPAQRGNPALLSNPVDLGAGKGEGSYGIELAAFELPKGRWLRINQELVLNRPEQSDGTLRIFIDGRLVFERTDMNLRATADTRLQGVAVASHVIGADARYPGGTDGAVWFTPFELYW